jgi:hypothetical protein
MRDRCRAPKRRRALRSPSREECERVKRRKAPPLGSRLRLTASTGRAHSRARRLPALHRGFLCPRDRNFRVRDKGRRPPSSGSFRRLHRHPCSHSRQIPVVGADGDPGPPGWGVRLSPPAGATSGPIFETSREDAPRWTGRTKDIYLGNIVKIRFATLSPAGEGAERHVFRRGLLSGKEPRRHPKPPIWPRLRP